MKIVPTALVVLATSLGVQAQNLGDFKAVVKDKNTQETLPGVEVLFIAKDTVRLSSDDLGVVSGQLPFNTYKIRVEGFGYEALELYNINIGGGNAQVLEFELSEKRENLSEFTFVESKTVRATDMITPMSTQKLTAEEIKVNPGGNFDVSKVIQVLPGVGGGTSPNRNDIIVRGGGPSENVYYLDGIEIPVLNHFQTQGASGGATGILNVSFIDNVQLTSSAFDSKYDNALASTFVIKQRQGNSERQSGNFRLSGSEAALTLEGPLSKKTTYMASARRSYLKYLFQVLDLPIRPDYWDFQFKVHHQINKKTELTLLGLGAIDKFSIESPKNADAETEYTNRANPLIDQWNYTVGASLKRLINNGYATVALSRNTMDNKLRRYEDNANRAGDLLFNTKSQEQENKLRLDINKYKNGWKWSYGASAQYVVYSSNLFNTIKQAEIDSAGNQINPAQVLSQSSELDFFKFGFYGHLAKRFAQDRLLISGGLRSDMNSFTNEGMNPLKTLSPRISMAYTLSKTWNLTGSVGSYYKLAPYTALGFKDNNGGFGNKDLSYINAIHYTLGTEWVPNNSFRFTVEGFYKDYSNYLVSKTNGISLANIGTDFSAIGNDLYSSNGKGRVYGLEAYAQQKLLKRLFYVVSATVYSSEFSGADGKLVPSTWDYGLILSTTVGYKFNRNWDLGVKYRYANGQPYTPFDPAASRVAYLSSGRGVYDYTQLNTLRLPAFHQLDLRLDKKYNFKKTSLIAYVDLQNVFLYKTANLPKYTFERNTDNTEFETTDGSSVKLDGSNAIPKVLNNRSATVVPSIGFIFEF